MKRHMLATLFAMASLFAFPLASNAATYYVSQYGDDSNAGTSWETALKTPYRGFAKINSDKGSTLIISNGVYQMSSAIGCTGGSSEADRSIVTSFTGNPDDVILDALGKHEGLRLASYITVSGITVSNGVVKAGNSTSTWAAGIRFANNSGTGDDYQIVISNCVVTCCTNAIPSGRVGAVVGLIGHNLLVDSVIRNNTSVSGNNGAGVTVVNRSSLNSTPKMLRCRVEGNSSAKHGGGVYAARNANAETNTSGGGTVVEMEDCQIVGNISVEDGAGVYAPEYHHVKMTRCTVKNNRVTKSGENGGGVRVEKGSVTMVDCMIEGNAAESGGGVDIFPQATSPAAAIATLICTNTVFRDNTVANSGGGVRIYQHGRAFFDDCRFEGNKTTSESSADNNGGGGVMLTNQGAGAATSPYGYCSVSNCVFGGNVSGARAGGLGCTWNTNFCGVVVNTIFTNNQSRIQGGGLCIREAEANPTPAIIRNCLFAFNETTADASKAESNGGGVLLVTKSNLVMENCTIVSNNIRNATHTSSKSGGIHHRWGGTLKNCIVAFNTRCGQPEDTDFWNADSAITAANYIKCCSDRAIAKFTEANGCITADPKFVDPTNGDFSLQASSPCRDKGVNTDWMETAFDLLGKKRIVGDYVDIGCFEYCPIPGLMIIVR